MYLPSLNASTPASMSIEPTRAHPRTLVCTTLALVKLASICLTGCLPANVAFAVTHSTVVMLRLALTSMEQSVSFQTLSFKHHVIDGMLPISRMHYWRPKTNAKPSVIIMFCPGNPGLLGYYKIFLDQLHASLPENFALLAHAHVGHTPDLPAPPRTLTLFEQIDCKVELLDALGGELRDWASVALDSRIALMGHSVGAYMVVEILKRRSEIQHAFLLFPTLGNIAQTPNGVRLRPLFREPVLSLLPIIARVLPMIIPLYRRLPLPGSLAANETTIQLLSSPVTIAHVLRLARSEMDSILEPDWAWYALPTTRARLWSYWGQQDGWVGTEGDKLRRILKDEQEDEEVCLQVMNCRENIPHAYCLAHSGRVAEIVRRWVWSAFDA